MNRLIGPEFFRGLFLFVQFKNIASGELLQMLEFVFIIQ
jgi:hypothetical protein